MFVCVSVYVFKCVPCVRACARVCIFPSCILTQMFNSAKRKKMNKILRKKKLNHTRFRRLSVHIGESYIDGHSAPANRALFLGHDVITLCFQRNVQLLLNHVKLELD